MNFQELARIAGISHAGTCDADSIGFPDLEITAITEDSRRVTPGALFCAVQGERSDGHDYVGQAAKAGAVAILGDRPGITEMAGLPYVYAAPARRALGIMAHALAGDPSREMKVVGVTGTNGKSSIAVLTHHILNHCGYMTSCFGTLGYAIGGHIEPAPHTTPFPEDLAAMMRAARDAWSSHVVMEVSSHALEQDRVAGIEFTAASFTNLTQDHLDFHADMDAYRAAKLKLFERVTSPKGFTVVNRDDPSAGAFVAASQVRCYTYGSGGDLQAHEINIGRQRMTFRAVTPWGEAHINTHLLGRHNVGNLLNVIAICGGLGVELDRIAAAIQGVARVPGRFESIDMGQAFRVIVDYAHTEDGLRNVLAAARDICQGRIITVFGCGGDRDRTKRPKMARAVAELSDYAIITSDNPRTEDPIAIIEEIEAGMRDAGKVKGSDYHVEPDRRSAIRSATERAGAGDLVMIAGKGHEDYQILGTERIHFDDAEEARAALEAR